jgi:hypothetical protein
MCLENITIPEAYAVRRWPKVPFDNPYRFSHGVTTEIVAATCPRHDQRDDFAGMKTEPPRPRLPRVAQLSARPGDSNDGNHHLRRAGRTLPQNSERASACQAASSLVPKTPRRTVQRHRTRAQESARALATRKATLPVFRSIVRPQHDQARNPRADVVRISSLVNLTLGVLTTVPGADTAAVPLVAGFPRFSCLPEGARCHGEGRVLRPAEVRHVRLSPIGASHQPTRRASGGSTGEFSSQYRCQKRSQRAPNW